MLHGSRLPRIEMHSARETGGLFGGGGGFRLMCGLSLDSPAWRPDYYVTIMVRAQHPTSNTRPPVYIHIPRHEVTSQQSPPSLSLSCILLMTRCPPLAPCFEECPHALAHLGRRRNHMPAAMLQDHWSIEFRGQFV